MCWSNKCVYKHCLHASLWHLCHAIMLMPFLKGSRECENRFNIQRTKHVKPSPKWFSLAFSSRSSSLSLFNKPDDSIPENCHPSSIHEHANRVRREKPYQCADDLIIWNAACKSLWHVGITREGREGHYDTQHVGFEHVCACEDNL